MLLQKVYVIYKLIAIFH